VDAGCVRGRCVVVPLELFGGGDNNNKKRLAEIREDGRAEEWGLGRNARREEPRSSTRT
jgi:hypothetical protein